MWPNQLHIPLLPENSQGVVHAWSGDGVKRSSVGISIIIIIIIIIIIVIIIIIIRYCNWVFTRWQ
jgi:hypothetical protein